MSLAHRITSCLAVTSARLRSQPLRVGLLLCGTAVAFAMLVAVLGASLVARQQSLERALRDLPETERGFRVDRFGLPLDQRAYRAVDRRARRALASLGGGATRRVIVFRELRIAGERVEIGAADELPGLLDVRSGRLPRACNSRECEVVQIGNGGSERLAEGGVRLRRVGIARLHDAALFGDVSAAAVGAAEPPTLLLARDLAALQELPSLRPFYRVYSWVSPLDVERLHTWDIGGVLRDESRTQAILAADPAFRLSGPDAALLDAQRRGQTAERRLLLVGGATSALLLGFAVLAAMGLRRGLLSERRRLFTRGATRWQVALMSLAEIAAVTTAGAALGIGCAVVVVAGIAAAADLPVAAAVRHAVLTDTTLFALLVAWSATTLVLLLAALAPEHVERRRIRLVDVAACGAAAVAVVAIARGALDPDSDSSGDALLLLALPTLVSFVAAVVLARLVPPAMRAAERLTRGRSVNLRLAMLALARAPARTIVSCAFVAVALALALFAAAYRATLSRGAADQAAFAVPLDFSVEEGARLTRPLDAAPLSGYRRVVGTSAAYPVLRLSGTTPGRGTTVLSPTLLGVPADAVARLRWRSDYSSASPAALAARLAPGGAVRPAVVALPQSASRLQLTVRSSGSDVDVGLVLQRQNGAFTVLRLGRVQDGVTTLSGRIPADARRVFALQLTLPPAEQFFLAHRETEGRVSVAPSGTLDLGALRADGTDASNWRGWRLASGGRAVPAGKQMRLEFVFGDTGGRLIFRPRQPTDGQSVPVVVSRDIAGVVGSADDLTVDLQGVSLPARIVGVARRMPSVRAETDSFVLADEQRLSTTIDAQAPGRGRPNEVWIAAQDHDAVAAALRRPPFSKLVMSSRAELEQQLEDDPLAHATALTLAAAAIVSLVLALVGFWVALASELRDERSDFFDLEAQGIPPAGLRAQLRTRAGVVVGVALLAGIAVGALLSQLVVSIVRISATADVPEPPLLLAPAWLTWLLAVITLAACAWLVLELTARSAFRSARPERASWSLE
ncbi:MAG: FtsX-like permease family protein [Gaiellaceae bacterium]